MYAPAPKGHTTGLYRIYDHDMRLLYVGISDYPQHRIQTHSNTAPWWMLAQLESLEWLETRKQAESAEQRAARFEGPLYNSVYCELFGGTADDARRAIPSGLTIRPCPWVKPSQRQQKQPPIPVRLTNSRFGSVSRLPIPAAAKCADEIRNEHANRSDLWDSEYAGVPEPWGNYAIVSRAFCVRVIDGDWITARAAACKVSR